jgi:hypothetical protein
MKLFNYIMGCESGVVKSRWSDLIEVESNCRRFKISFVTVNTATNSTNTNDKTARKYIPVPRRGCLQEFETLRQQHYLDNRLIDGCSDNNINTTTTAVTECKELNLSISATSTTTPITRATAIGNTAANTTLSTTTATASITAAAAITATAATTTTAAAAAATTTATTTFSDTITVPRS